GAAALGALEPSMPSLPPGRQGRPPMQMKLILRDSVTVAPNTTAANDRSCWAENGFELCPRGFRICVALDGDGEALNDVVLGCSLGIAEGRQWRTKHHRLRLLSPPPGI